MSEDLEAKLYVARDQLRRLVAAWDFAWSINLDIGPRVDNDPRISGSRNDDHHVGLLTIDAETDDVQLTELADSYYASVGQMQDAVVAASELSWVDDNVAQTSVLPRGQTHVSLAAGHRMAREVNYALIGAQWRLHRDCVHFPATEDKPARTQHHHLEAFTEDDAGFLEELCDKVTDALNCMPGDLHHQTSRTLHPTTKRCEGAPGRKTCNVQVPWGTLRCAKCVTTVEVIVLSEPRLRGEPCTNPWSRPECTGTVEVPKHGRCRSCDQAIRDWLRRTG